MSEGQAHMRILVVEDNAIIGMDFVLTLQELGHDVNGPHASVDSALTALETFKAEAAILDVDLLDGETSAPIASVLQASGIPFVCVTGYSAGTASLTVPFENAPKLEKPVKRAEFRAVLNSLVASPVTSPPGTSRLVPKVGEP